MPEEKRKYRVWENFLRDYSWNFPQHGKWNNLSNPRGTENPIQDRPQEKHFKTHTNQTKKEKNKQTNKQKQKNKERILKAARKKQQVTYKGNYMLKSWSFSRNSAGQKGMAGCILSIERGKSTTKITVPARISVKIDGEIKSFSDKQNLREFSTTKPALEQMLKGLI